MPGAKGTITGLLALLLTACQGTAPTPAPDQPAEPLLLESQTFTSLRTASCPDPAAFITPQANPLTITPVQPETLKGATLDGLRFAGGWHLASSEPNFGGLSGLSIHPKDHLVTVSDAGAFVWISMANGAPSGISAISYMLDETGTPLEGKRDADAEGLEMVEGMALVSFERNHRILAFDLANCGAAAKGIQLATIPRQPDGLPRAIPDNEGAEALVLASGKTLKAGLELKASLGAPILDITHGETALTGYLPRPSDKRLVGLDELGDTIFVLYRSYSPLSGNANDIHAHDPGNPDPKILATLKRPFPVDNFEGITATELPDGTVRLYIISDDNFSDRQRTLLLAFDIVQ